MPAGWPPNRVARLVKPVCLNAAETREMVKSHHLLEPFAALKFAGAQRKAEALSASSAADGDDFIYEITLLHRDGRLRSRDGGWDRENRFEAGASARSA